MSQKTGRPRKFRNDADKQKAYRQRKKAQKAQAVALRNSHIRDLLKSLSVATLPQHYPAIASIPMQHNYFYCPCRQTHWLFGHYEICPHCRNTLKGAIEYMEGLQYAPSH